MGEEKRRKDAEKKVVEELKQVMEGKTDEEKAVIAAHASNQMGKPMRPGKMGMIGFIQDRFDACTDKIVGDFGRVLTNRGYAPLIVLTKDYKDALDYICNYLVLFRTGYYPESERFIKNVNEFRHYMRKFGVPTVYYADDHIWPFTQGAPAFLANNSDKVIVTSEYIRNVIKNEYGITKPIDILPTHIDLNRFDNDCKVIPWKEKKFRILYTSQGGIGINILSGIVEAMNEDPEEYKDVEIFMVCQQVGLYRAKINRYRNVHKRYYDWLSLNTFYSLAKSCDVIIAPGEAGDCGNENFNDRARLHWLHSKSEVKYCLAGAAGIPLIASPTEPYMKSVQDSETGFLAVNTPDFLKWINVLRYDPELRASIGAAARLDIEKKYNSVERANQFLELVLDTSKIKPATARAAGPKRVFIPKSEGGPQSFERNMMKWLPIVSRGKWEVSNELKDVDVVMNIAFIEAPAIEVYKADHPYTKQIFRVDGLPLHFNGDIFEEQLRSMLETFGHADSIVWQSNHCKKFWAKYGVNTEGGYTVHNGVDLDVYTADGPKMTGLPDEKVFKVLHLNWSTFPHKRFDYLKIFSQWAEQLNKEKYNIQVLAVGNYASVQQIENQQFFSGTSIKYLGNIMDKGVEGQKVTASLLRGVDALVFTSEMEGSPHVLFEALACKKIIFANPNSDIVDEICGDLHYKIGAYADLEYAIDELSNKEVFEAKQLAARKIALEYSTQHMVEKYCEVLNAL